MCGESFFRMRIKLDGAGVSLSGGVELHGIKGLEPRAKPRQLARGKLSNGFLDVFDRGHARNLALGQGAEKGLGWLAEGVTRHCRVR